MPLNKAGGDCHTAKPRPWGGTVRETLPVAPFYLWGTPMQGDRKGWRRTITVHAPGRGGALCGMEKRPPPYGLCLSEDPALVDCGLCYWHPLFPRPMEKPASFLCSWPGCPYAAYSSTGRCREHAGPPQDSEESPDA